MSQIILSLHIPNISLREGLRKNKIGSKSRYIHSVQLTMKRNIYYDIISEELIKVHPRIP